MQNRPCDIEKMPDGVEIPHFFAERKEYDSARITKSACKEQPECGSAHFPEHER